VSLALGAEILNGVYADLGVAVDYMPKGTAAWTSVLILPDSGNDVFDVSGLDLTAEKTIFKLRRSEVATVGIGDHFKFPEDTKTVYKVATAPRLYDIEKREWTLELHVDRNFQEVPIQDPPDNPGGI